MNPILTLCGYRCDLCLAFKPNVEKNPSNQQILSDGWFKYFGFRVEPASIICDGCMADHPRLIDQSCSVRSCALEKGVTNCSQCEQYICDKLNQRIVTFEEVRSRVGENIPEDDYYMFIQPYENKRRLDIFKATGEVIK